MRIIHFIIKNTSSIDFSLPILWKLNKNNPSIDLTIFYCSINKRDIVGEASYYHNIFKEIGARELDLMDLTHDSYVCKILASVDSLMVKLVDGLSLDNLINTRKFYSRLHELLLYLVYKIIKKIINKSFEYILTRRDYFHLLKYDVALVDNREYVNFPGAREIFGHIFENHKKPVVILPHAPHYLDQFFSHVPVNPFGKDVYDHCDIWVPFHSSTPSHKRPELEKQFFYSGYPGFDSEWINYNKSINERSDGDEKKHILYIGRKFLDKNSKRPDGYNFVTMDYNDVLSELNVIYDSIATCGCDYLFIFKMHPSSSEKLVRKLLIESKLQNYVISRDASYSFIGTVDLVVAPYSTAIFSYAISGIATIILKSDMTDEVTSNWGILSKLYENMEYYIDKNKMEKTLVNVVLQSSAGKDDIHHLRKFYKDGNLELCNSRIYHLGSR